MTITNTCLIPIQELTPGQVGAIRNQAIQAVVALASRELAMTEDRLVVRDVRPTTDLELYEGPADTAAYDKWEFDVTETAGYIDANSASATMADQRYVCLFGVRDRRLNIGGASGASGATTAAGAVSTARTRISLIKVIVGGAEKVIWDTTNLEAYSGDLVGFTSSPVIIPQNASYKVQYYHLDALGGRVYLQLIGVVVEPRGKVVSP
jgi:hypothetical protein